MPRPKLVWNNRDGPVRSERYVRLKTVPLPFVRDINIETDTPVAKFTAAITNLNSVRPSKKYFMMDKRFRNGLLYHPDVGLYGTMAYLIRDPRNGKIHTTSLHGVKLAEYSYQNDMITIHLLMNQFYSEIRKRSHVDIIPARDTPETLFAELEDRVMKTAKQYSI